MLTVFSPLFEGHDIAELRAALRSFGSTLSAARDLEGYGDGRSMIVIAVSKSPFSSLAGSLLWPAMPTQVAHSIRRAPGSAACGVHKCGSAHTFECTPQNRF